MSRFRLRSFSILLSFFFILSACGEDPDDPLDNQTIDIPDGDTDADGDADGDTDADSDGDTDADADSDGDTDADSDGDVDGDTDADADSDADGDTDGDIEGAVNCPAPMPTPAAGERCSVTPGSSDYLLIRGTVLAGDEVYARGGVLLDESAPNRNIVCSGCDCIEDAEELDATIVSCPDSVISPGLINPHDHITYTEGRPQPHGEERFDHRHDWRRGLRDHTEINTYPRSPSSAGNLREVVLLGELRMLLGGATSIAGSVGSSDPSGLLRNLDNTNYLEGLSNVDVNYSTFPLGDASNIRFLEDGCGYSSIANESQVENSGIYLPHIAEGIDQAARNELTCLAGESGRNLVRDNTSIIHGIAVDARDVALIAARGANLVWSPRTNIDLYGNTAPAPLYERFGVPISLGTDWTTSGSMNMLRELQCADYLNRMHYNEHFTDQEIWKMATINAAISMGAEHSIGLLYPDYVADITIFDSTDRLPYRAVIDADVSDVLLVMRGGNPLYGDASLVEALVGQNEVGQCETIDICGADRRVCLEKDTGLNFDEIAGAVHPDSYPPFFCGEPEDEPSCVPFRPLEYDGISTAQDISGDGVADAMDNCPDYFNPIRPMDGATQSDINGNGIGDVCDPCPLSEDPECTGIDPLDWSGDGIPNDEDNCPFHYNPDQTDTSEDGIGDACHPCAEVSLADGEPCPQTIYDIKTEVVGDGAQVSIREAIITAIQPGEALFLQIPETSDLYDGPEYSGIYTFIRNNTTVADADPQVGDRVRVVGAVSHFFDQIQLANVTSLEVLESNVTLPSPVIVDPADVATGGPLQEAYEGVLVEVLDVVVTDTDVPAGPGDSDPSNEFIVDSSLHVNDLMYLADPFPGVGEVYESIRGVLRFANGNNKLEPRNELDIISGPPKLDQVLPNPVFLEVTGNSVPAFEVVLNRPAEVDTVIAINDFGSTAISVADSVTVLQGETSALVDVTALQADQVADIEFTLDDTTLPAQVTTFDVATPRTIEAFTTESTSVSAFSDVSFTIELNVPASDTGETVNFSITPSLDATFDTAIQFGPGERVATVDVLLGSDEGSFVATAELDGNSETIAFDIFPPVVDNLETFTNYDGSGSSYVSGSFIGDGGFTWEYAGARPAISGYEIEGTGIILGGSSDKFVRAEGIEGGISSFSIEMLKAFTNSNNRQLELFINGTSVATSQVFGPSGDGEILVFEFPDLDITGEFDLEIRSIGPGQITIDNLAWTSNLN